MRSAAQDMRSNPSAYVLYGARLSHVASIMDRYQTSAVPIVGFIEELGWQGPQVIGVCAAWDALKACWERDAYPYKNKPQNICVQSVMQRDVLHLYRDPSSEDELRAAYEAVLNHYRQTH